MKQNKRGDKNITADGEERSETINKTVFYIYRICGLCNGFQRG